MTDLSLISEDDIWEELSRRNDACVLITLRNPVKGEEEISVSYHGGKYTCIGLTSHVAEKLLSELNRSTTDSQP